MIMRENCRKMKEGKKKEEGKKEQISNRIREKSERKIEVERVKRGKEEAKWEKELSALWMRLLNIFHKCEWLVFQPRKITRMPNCDLSRCIGATRSSYNYSFYQ